MMEKLKNAYEAIPIFLIALIIGFGGGIYVARVIYTSKVDESIKTERFLYNKLVYNITLNGELNK